MESPFEQPAKPRFVFAKTIEEARALHTAREEELESQAVKDRQEEMAAWSRLLKP